MNGYGFFIAIQRFLALGFIVSIGVFVSAGAVYRELSKEIAYSQKYGEGWKAEYENSFGSLTEARVKAVIYTLGCIAIFALATWLYKILRPTPQPVGFARNLKVRRHSPGSTVDRLVRFRRHALVGNYFGLAGIFSGVALVVFRVGLFADHRHEVVLGLFLLAGGYVGVIAGCWWWLKAKGWNEEVVVIGFLPLLVFFIPFVRLIAIRSPVLILAATVMMALILWVVVLVLPDKNSSARSRQSWDGRKITSDRSRRVNSKTTDGASG